MGIVLDFIVCVLIAVNLRVVFTDNVSYFVACIAGGIAYGLLKEFVRRGDTKGEGDGE